MATMFKLYYGANIEKPAGVFETDPLEGWNGEAKTLRVTDVKDRKHTLQLSPEVAVRSVSFTPGSGKMIVM